MDRIAFYAAIDTSDRDVAAEVLRRWLRQCGLTGAVESSGTGLRYADAIADLSCHLTDGGPGTVSFFMLEGSFVPAADGPGLQLGALAPLCQAANLGYGVRYVPAPDDGRPAEQLRRDLAGEPNARLLAAQLREARLREARLREA